MNIKYDLPFIVCDFLSDKLTSQKLIFDKPLRILKIKN